MLGNTQLVEYGILNESSDIRAHVSVATGRVYIFPTERGKECVLRKTYRLITVRTNGIPTAQGWLVPPEDIWDCSFVAVPDNAHLNIGKWDSTSQKGRKAVSIVTKILKMGLFPMSFIPNQVEDRDMQIQGVDLIVALTARIQVKCDFEAGHKEYGGSGNLFLQKSECNPYKEY